MEYFGDILREYPALAVFLTVGLGFLFGRLKIGSFTLGSVTAVLLVGVVVGQLHITVGGPLKPFFFMMFLFAIGYSVGPEFFRSLRGMGLRQAFFAVLMSMSCFAVTVGLAYLFGYNKGETVGLFAGSQTCSSLIGVGSEAISKLRIDDTLKTDMLNIIPVCYALTYVFGTLGTVIILGNFGPRLLGGVTKVKDAAKQLELELLAGKSSGSPEKEEAGMHPNANATDLMFMGLAIFIGGFLGAITIWAGSVPISFGTSGGALIAGIFFGWLRKRRPSLGHIPAPALWLMNNLGLNLFIAVVGIEAGPSFVEGLKEVGWMLFVAGAVGTTIPLFFGLWLGHRVFRFNPAITLGCCAGTRTCTASLGAVQNMIGSTVPTIGYTVTYAVSNILLVIWGMVTVMLV